MVELVAGSVSVSASGASATYDVGVKFTALRLSELLASQVGVPHSPPPPKSTLSGVTVAVSVTLPAAQLLGSVNVYAPSGLPRSRQLTHGWPVDLIESGPPSGVSGLPGKVLPPRFPDSAAGTSAIEWPGAPARFANTRTTVLRSRASWTPPWRLVIVAKDWSTPNRSDTGDCGKSGSSVKVSYGTGCDSCSRLRTGSDGWFAQIDDDRDPPGV